MKSRQRGAIEHPIPHSPTAEGPHSNRIERMGNRCSIFTVTEVMPNAWVWHASFSYGDLSGGALYLGAWSAGQVRKGDRELRSMLDGVGGEFVFGIKPAHVDLPKWEEMGLQNLDVINDADATAFVSESLGLNLPCPPAQFSAMHLWRELTPDELKLLTN